MTQTLQATDLSRVPTGNLILRIESLDHALMRDTQAFLATAEQIDNLRRQQAKADRPGWSYNATVQAKFARRIEVQALHLSDIEDDMADGREAQMMRDRREIGAELRSRGVICPCDDPDDSLMHAWRSLASTVRMAREVNRVMCRSDADRQRLADDWARLGATCAEHGIADIYAIIRRKPLPA